MATERSHRELTLLYRKARPEDLGQVASVFATAIDDLDKRHGFFVKPTPTFPPNPQYSFWLKKDPDSFWVAEDDGRIAGYTFSFLRGSLWFLADLFVIPDYQGRGVGRSLIERTLGSWKDHRIANRALITPAFNRSSASLYMQFGTFPRQPLYFASAPVERIVQGLESRDTKGLESEESTDIGRVYPLLNRIDKHALGFPLGWHHEFFFGVQQARCFIFKRKNSAEGYAYVRRNGRIGPLVVTSASSFGPALEASLSLAAEGDIKDVTVFFAGSNEAAASACVKHGFRVTYPLLFMSTRPLGIWDNYMLYSPGLM